MRKCNLCEREFEEFSREANYIRHIVLHDGTFKKAVYLCTSCIANIFKTLAYELFSRK